MRKKLCFLMCFVLVFCLSSAVEGATPIDVNNFSFEFDSNESDANDINQILCHIGMENVLTWEVSGGAWVGVDPYCLGDASYDPCAIPRNICLSEECYTDSHDGCHCWPATHGICWAYIQASEQTYLYQELDPNDANAIIAPGRKYTLTYDSMSEIYGAVVNYLAIHSGFFYGQGEPEHVDISSTSYVLPVWIGDFEEWEHEWVRDLTLKWVCPPHHPFIGEVLGIKFWTPNPGGSVRAYVQVDNVRLEWSWATEAYNPSPTDGEKYVDQNTDLTWIPGLWAADTSGHILYYGTDWTDVNERSRTGDTNDYFGDMNSFDPGTLELGATYYWTVTEVNENYEPIEGIPYPPWLGEIWSFTVEGRAANPSPEDEAKDVSLYSAVKWEPGTGSETHDVYFGTDVSAVEEANNSPGVWEEYKGNYDVNSWDPPGLLDLGQTYYWRIDELRDDGGTKIIKGYVWSFTVAEFLMIDDMESYESDTDFLDVWVEDETTWAFITLNTDEPNYIHSDGNSMSYNYANWTWPHYSEVTRTFDPLEDWTVSGFKVLTLYFRADALNGPNDVQRFYVILEDDDGKSDIAEYDDPNDLVRFWAGWQEWNMELAEFDIDLTKVKSMTIGVGTPGNTLADSGYVHIDDIRLYPMRCVVEKAIGSFTNDCDVDAYDLAVLASDWLISGIGNVTADTEPSKDDLHGHWKMNDDAPTSVVLDSSGNLNHGVFYDDVTGDGTLVEGATQDHSITEGAVDDYALEFDGEDDYVEIPALDVNSNTITLTAWVKRAAQGHAYDGIVMSSNNYDPCDDILGPNYTAGLQFGSDTSDWSANYELSFMWTGFSWEWHTGLFVPSEEWTFTALTVAPEVATLYLYDGMFFQAARNYDNYEPLPWHVPFHIADQMQFGPPPESERFFPGEIDDVRIYNRTLAPEEILYLALQEPGSWYLPLEPWRANANPGTDDPDKDDIVNLKDFAIMADNWFTEVLWP